MRHLIRTTTKLFPVLGFATIALLACSRQPVVTPGVTEGVVPPTQIPEVITVTLPTETGAAPALSQGTASASPLPTSSGSVETPVISQTITNTATIAGVEMHSLTPAGGLDLVAEAGISWVRRNSLSWAAVEPTKGTRNWQAVSALEAELKNAAERDLEVILIVRDTPAWARKMPGVACGPVAENELESFGAFLHDMVARYSQAPYNVRYFELWNEPDVAPGSVLANSVFGCWGDATQADFGGAYYAEMLKAAYPQMKSADAEAQVLVGGLLLDCDPDNPPTNANGTRRDCKGSLFLDGILKAGGGDFFDGVSYHAYDYSAGELGAYGNPGWSGSSEATGPVLALKASYLNKVLQANGHAEKYLVNTEVALICAGKEPACVADPYEKSKAYYVAQSNAAALAAGLRANIWYSITGWRYSGLVDKSMKPLPGFEAEKVSAEMLRGATFVGELNQFPNVKGYAFQRGDTRLWVLWSMDGKPHPLTFQTVPSRVVGVFGEQLSPDQVEYEPVYIEWAP